MGREKIAVYPGSFDPITNGHIDIIQRGLKIFDRLIVAVAINSSKNYLFSLEERVETIKSLFNDESRITVDSFEGLLVEYLEQNKTNIVLRGLRAVSDFEYEFQMTLMNRKLYRKVETIFMMTGYRWFYTSSSIIKEAAISGGSVKDLVPEIVHQKLKGKFPLYGRYPKVNNKKTEK